MIRHPALPLLLAALVVAVLPRRRTAAVWLGSVLLLAAPVASLALVVGGLGTVGPSVSWYGLVLDPLRIDGLSAVFAGVFAVAAFLAGLYGLRFASRTEQVAGLVTAAAATGVVLAGDLVTLFVWWEAKAVASSVVVAAAATDAGRRAAWRYLVVHLVGGGVLLAGIAWHVATTGSIAFDMLGGGAATVLIAVAFLLCAALPPLHLWLTDAYPRASVSGTVLLSAFTTKAAVYALARGVPGVDGLVWLGVAMALVGVVLALLQDDLRRLLAYDLVGQVGFMVAAIGVGTADAINGATAHAAAHVLYKALLLMGVGAAIRATGRDLGSRLGGLARVQPVVLGLYLVGALSISGVPLFSGFVTKELTIHALSDAGLSAAVVGLKIAAAGTVVAALCKLPYVVWLRASSEPVPVRAGHGVTPTMYGAMGLGALACVVIGTVPHLLWDRLPYPQDYSPFYARKLVETLLLVGAAIVVFWLVRRWIAPRDGVVVRLDALRSAAVVDRLRSRWIATSPAVTAPAAVAPGAAAPRELASAGVVRTTIRPTWLLGTVLFIAALAVAVGSLIGSQIGGQG